LDSGGPAVAGGDARAAHSADNHTQPGTVNDLSLKGGA